MTPSARELLGHGAQRIYSFTLTGQPAAGYRVTKQAYKLDGTTLVAVGPPSVAWRPASPREREGDTRAD